MQITSKGEDPNCQDAPVANTGESQGGNEGLKEVYDEMHSKGPSSWFSDGRNERELILKMGEPWGKIEVPYYVLEIGCGEGDLSILIAAVGLKNLIDVRGVDYSEEAIKKANEKMSRYKEDGPLYPKAFFIKSDYKYLSTDKELRHNRIVMQGVLEHLDAPFAELKWMIDNLLTGNGDVITSSPGFLNPRGFVLMTLQMLGAVISKTDLHQIHPWQMEEFCEKSGYKLEYQTTDNSWAAGPEMIKDLTERIPLALRDGGIKYSDDELNEFIAWLAQAGSRAALGHDGGATIVYKIST